MLTIEERIARKEKELKQLKKKKSEAQIKQKVDFFDKLTKELNSDNLFKEKFLTILEEHGKNDLKNKISNSLITTQE